MDQPVSDEAIRVVKHLTASLDDLPQEGNMDLVPGILKTRVLPCPVWSHKTN